MDTIERAWDQREDEPGDWFRIFKDYYLPLGSERSLRNAFEFYIRVESPEQYVDLDPDNFKNIPQHWNSFADKFEWAKRALAYDEATQINYNEVIVNQVLDYLRNNAMTAARALVDALTNDRTRVQAANAILNRGGIPEVSEVNIRSAITVTADDMAEARKRVEDWTQNKSG